MTTFVSRVGFGLAPIFVTALVACGSQNATQSGAVSPSQPSSASEGPSASEAPSAAVLGPLCEAFVVRQRTCVHEYLNALLDVRIEVDMPRGIAAEAEKDGRDALLKRARAEWGVDSTPEKMAAMCAQMTQTPAEHVPRLKADGERCLATPDCATFAVCAVGNERSFIESGDTH